MQLKTAGELRGFLVEVLVGIRDGSIDANQANAISKIASQINSSLSCEIQARTQLKELGENSAGEMVIAKASTIAQVAALSVVERKDDAPGALSLDDATEGFRRAQEAGKVWCDQCDMRVKTEDAASCKSRHCKAKVAA